MGRPSTWNNRPTSSLADIQPSLVDIAIINIAIVDIELKAKR